MIFRTIPPLSASYGLRGRCPALIVVTALVLAISATFPPVSPVCAQPAASPAAEEEGLPEPKELTLPTSDGVELIVQYFAAPGKDKPQATVILVHDLGGSSENLDPLAESLQTAGCAVLAPDLRGHGGSSHPVYSKQAAEGEQWKLLKLNDFKAMTITAGGRVRGQSDIG